MSLMQALVMGIIQGLTEFIPISSSAHLRVVPALLGWSDPGVAFSAVIQLGSVIAVLGYFANDLMAILGGSVKAIKNKDFTGPEVRLLGAILLGTLPICILGLAFKHIIEEPHGPLRSLVVIGIASMVMGVLLLVSEKIGKHRRNLDEIGAQDGLLVGLGQALALIPGCSRSGSTLTVAMLLNMKRADAAKFSFLLGIPAILLSGLLELKESITHFNASELTSLLVGLFSSLIVSYLSIAWLLKFLRNHSTGIFIAYRLIFGALVIYLASHNLIN